VDGEPPGVSSNSGTKFFRLPTKRGRADASRTINVEKFESGYSSGTGLTEIVGVFPRWSRGAPGGNQLDPMAARPAKTGKARACRKARARGLCRNGNIVFSRGAV